MAENLVVAAILADAAFDAVSDAIRFSTQEYREIIEQMARTGELPQTWNPAPTTDIRVASRATSASAALVATVRGDTRRRCSGELVVAVFLALLISTAGIAWINLSLPEVWPLRLAPWLH
jgi:hypothetical protein